MITLSWASLTTLCAAVGIIGFGVGVALAMAKCHHPDSRPPSLK